MAVNDEYLKFCEIFKIGRWSVLVEAVVGEKNILKTYVDFDWIGVESVYKVKNVIGSGAVKSLMLSLKDKQKIFYASMVRKEVAENRLKAGMLTCLKHMDRKDEVAAYPKCKFSGKLFLLGGNRQVSVLTTKVKMDEKMDLLHGQLGPERKIVKINIAMKNGPPKMFAVLDDENTSFFNSIKTEKDLAWVEQIADDETMSYQYLIHDVNSKYILQKSSKMIAIKDRTMSVDRSGFFH